MLPKRTSASYFYVLLHARACLTAAPAAAYLLTAAAASSSLQVLLLSHSLLQIFSLYHHSPLSSTVENYLRTEKEKSCMSGKEAHANQTPSLRVLEKESAGLL